MACECLSVSTQSCSCTSVKVVILETLRLEHHVQLYYQHRFMFISVGTPCWWPMQLPFPLENSLKSSNQRFNNMLVTEAGHTVPRFHVF